MGHENIDKEWSYSCKPTLFGRHKKYVFFLANGTRRWGVQIDPIIIRFRVLSRAKVHKAEWGGRGKKNSISIDRPTLLFLFFDPGAVCRAGWFGNAFSEPQGHIRISLTRLVRGGEQDLYDS